MLKLEGGAVNVAKTAGEATGMVVHLEEVAGATAVKGGAGKLSACCLFLELLCVFVMSLQAPLCLACTFVSRCWCILRRCRCRCFVSIDSEVERLHSCSCGRALILKINHTCQRPCMHLTPVVESNELVPGC